MRQKFLIAITSLAAAVACGVIAVNFMRPPTLPIVTPPKSNDRFSAMANQGLQEPARIEMKLHSIKPIVEPPLKWERVDAESVDTLPEGHDPYRTWDGPGVVMKRPEEFTNLHPAIREELTRRRCRIPQETTTTIPHNLIWGEFDHRGQQDLVVLCVREKSAVAYVFWAGDAARMEVFAFAGHGDTLTVGTPEDIEAHADPTATVTADMPQTIDHDAIEVGCCECCSSYYYRHRGIWFRAPGAD